MKKFSFAIATVLLVLALVSCATTGEAAPKTPKVTLVMGETETGYASLKSAVDAIPKGGEGTVIINEDISVTKEIRVEDKTVNVTDCGKVVTIKDRTADAEVKTNSIFYIAGSGKVVLSGTGSETLVFQGAPETSEMTNRTMFNVGDQAGDMSRDAELVINEGVVIQGIYSKYTGAVARGYGKFTINGGIVRNNTATVNGLLLCLYGECTINGGLFENNKCGGNGGLIQVTNTDGVSLTVNGGTFRNNNGGALGSIINTYDKSTLVINDCVIENNTATGTSGAAVYCVGKTTINGGTFKGNAVYDVNDVSRSAVISSSAIIDKLNK